MVTDKKDRTLVFIMLFLVFFSANCSKTSGNNFLQTQNGMQASFSISPAAPTAMQPAILSLSLKDTQGQPIDGAKVQFNLNMPGMMMAPNQPTATEKGGGQYQTEAMFTMSGDWQAEVSVNTGNENNIFNFNFYVK